MKSFKLIGVVILAIATSPAYAGPAEVKACAAKLSPQGMLILRTLVPKIKPGVDARDALTSTVVDLVESGKIAPADTKTEGRAAVECLKKMND